MRFLLFLVLFLDVKLIVKVGALVICCLLQPDFKWGIRFRNSRLPLFYPFIAGIACLNWILFKGWRDMDYNLVAITGMLFWALCFLGVHQVRLFTEKTDTELLHRTLLVFFLLNALISVAQVAHIIWETKALNPYLYQGDFQRYFISTGDYIKGLSFDTSTTNALINAFGVVYFLARKQGWMLVCCMACLLATGSNFTNLLLLAVFGYLFIFDSDKEQKGGIILCLLMGVIFLGKVSPQNNHYTEETFASRVHRTAPGAVSPIAADQGEAKKAAFAQSYLDSLSNERVKLHPPEARTQVPVVAPRVIPVEDINSAPYQRRSDTNTIQRKLLQFIETNREALPLASQPEAPDEARPLGKGLAFSQIFSFLGEHPAKILTGDGMGNFSSKLAFRTTGLDIAGGYPSRYAYISPDFLGHHLDIYLAYFSRPKQWHSLTNSPDSVYGQLLGEYGVLGLAAFVLLYIGFFGKRLKKHGYSIPLLLLLTGSFWMGYWFEQLSVVLLFEAMIFIDCKTVLKPAIS